MEDLYINFSDNITSYKLYNEILPQIPEDNELVKNRYNILFNFSDANYINAETIPNILILGLHIKNITEVPPQLYIPWKPNLLSYLHDIGFLQAVRSSDIFNVFEKTIGSYEKGKINPQSTTYIFEPGEKKESIIPKIIKSGDILLNFYNNYTYIAEKNLKCIINLIAELCENGCNHSENLCVLTIELNRTNRELIISISDCGIGYYQSFVNRGNYKFFENEILSEDKDINTKNLYSILSAVYHRSKEKVFGIYHAALEAIDQKVERSENVIEYGKIKITSDTLQINITKDGFGKYTEDHIGFSKLLLEEIRSSSIKDNFKKARRLKRSFKGVHIEIKIPL